MLITSSNNQLYTRAVDTNLVNTGILDVPGNAYSIASLVECLCDRERHRRPIAFIGAGASPELYPLWHQLLTDLGNTAVEQGIVTDEIRQEWMEIAKSDPPGVAKRIVSELGQAEFRNFMVTTVRRKCTSEG